MTLTFFFAWQELTLVTGEWRVESVVAVIEEVLIEVGRMTLWILAMLSDSTKMTGRRI
jgi:hypothetical protein